MLLQVYTEELLLRHGESGDKKSTRRPLAHKKLLAQALKDGLVTRKTLKEKYGVSPKRIASKKPVSSRAKKAKEKVSVPKHPKVRVWPEPRRGQLGCTSKPAWVVDADYTLVAFPDKGILNVENMMFDLGNDKVVMNGEPVHLRSLELVMLSVLMFHAGRVVTRSQLLYVLAEYGHYPSLGAFSVHLCALRKKLALGGAYLETKPDKGYVLQVLEQRKRAA